VTVVFLKIFEVTPAEWQQMYLEYEAKPRIILNVIHSMHFSAFCFFVPFKLKFFPQHQTSNRL
jgi:hypothetical protein